MKLLIFGANGWIGKQFLNHLRTDDYVIAASRADAEKEVEAEICEVKPTHLVSFIGRTHGGGVNTIDYLEQPGKLRENVRDNLYAPMVLALLAHKYNITSVYLGTGCIFSQEDPLSYRYSEDSEPDFFGSSYSTVKGFTDRLMHMFPKTVLNLRIRMPIVAECHPRNFITKIASYERVCSIPNSMTVLPDMFPIWVDMMKNNTTGTFNLVNPGVISHNEILEMYKELVDPSFEWKNFSVEEQNEVLASKRSNNQLDASKLTSLYPSVPEIHEAVRTCLMKYKKQ